MLRNLAGFAISYSALALAAFGVFREPASDSAPQMLALVGLTLLLIARLFERLQFKAKSERKLWHDLELGSLFVSAAFVFIEMTGGPAGLLYPIVYALVAFLVAFHGISQSLYFVALIIGTEVAIVFLQPSTDGLRLLLSHASFNLLFGFLYAMFLRVEVLTREHRMQKEIATHLDQISQQAKEFRLTSATSLFDGRLSATDLHQRRSAGSVQAIRESLYNVLAVAERALTPHTVALLWLDASEKFLRIKELRSRSDHINENSLNIGEGLIGAIVKRREPLVLTHLKNDHPGLVYYSRTEGITDFVGVPVLEGAHLRGVLVADRKNSQPFETHDVSVMTTLAGEIVRAIQVERIFSEMDRERYQKEKFYQASRDFNAALTVAQVADVAILAARRVADIEFAAVAVAKEQEGMLELASADWQGHPDVQNLVGKSFVAEGGLVGAAIKARHPLPHATLRAPSQNIFSSELPLHIPAVKVLPLLWKDIGVGALVLGSKREDFLSHDLLDMLRVIADHAAIAIANAQMYERMEKMATTDGLTGLTNHRYFQELFDSMVSRSERYSRKMSLILTDIDHFKAINDTYGHPMGDRVLKKVSGILAATARRTDIVARYGGEEFAILMEETGRQGAQQIAERIRKAVEAETFQSDKGAFRCTLSLGIATFPDDSTTKAKLTEGADQALYSAKRGGRNRVVLYHDLAFQNNQKSDRVS